MEPKFENLDPETRNILEQARSMGSANMRMGMDPIRMAEQNKLNEDMEKKNEEARRRRAANITGVDPFRPAPLKQAPIRRRRGTGVPSQDNPLAPINPVPELPPENAEPGAGNWEEMKKGFGKVKGNRVPRDGVEPIKEATPEPEKPKVPVVHAEPAAESIDSPYDRDPNADFDAFTRISKLPSQGQFYTGDVYGQSLKLIDNYALNDVIDGKLGARLALNTILSRRIRGIDTQDLLTLDEPYTLNWLRASSFPERGMVHKPYVCPHCKFDTATDRDPTHEYRVGFRNLKFTLSKDIETLRSMHLPNGYHSGVIGDGRECHVYLRRLRHATLLERFISEWESTNHTTIQPNLARIAAFATVVEIEGVDAPDEMSRLKEKVQFIAEMPRKYKISFEQLVVDGSASCSITAAVTCPNCGGVVEMPYPFLIPGFVSGL